MAKAIISSTYDDRYLYFIPLATWCWNKLGVDVICFLPHSDYMGSEAKNQVPAQIIRDTIQKYNLRCDLHYFNAPENKKPTYSQCSRLYGACLDLPEDEVLITSDVDMAVFKMPEYVDNITIFGIDLVPEGQYPICYASATVKMWRKYFEIEGKTYQKCLDNLLGNIEAEHFRGNYWGKDQETLFNKTSGHQFPPFGVKRARPNTQFADYRVDRDDINWRSYVNDELVDAHLWRPGYTDENFANILELLTIKYPEENFQWLIDYTNAYKQLL